MHSFCLLGIAILSGDYHVTNTFKLGSGLLLVAAIQLLTACGGSSSSTPPTETGFSGKASTFQRADFVIGQPDFVTGSAPASPTADTVASIMNGSGSGPLYLPDEYNNRVLGYHQIPDVQQAAADFVLGQADFTSNASGSNADQLNRPNVVVEAGNQLFVSDYGNHRVLIFDPAPQTGPTSAQLVIGQTGFGSNDPGCSSSSLRRPHAIAVVDGKLIVSDNGNHRVLIWNSIPESNGQPADLVLGQDSFTECAVNAGGYATASAGSLHNPTGIWSDGTRLAVVDSDNSRILIWNSFPTAEDKLPDLVLGQSNFTNNTENDDNQDGEPDTVPDSDQKIASARTFYFPYGQIVFNGKQFFVPDSDNMRVLAWNGFPTRNFQPADVVLGQSDFTRLTKNDDNQDDVSDGAPSARTFNSPYGLSLVNNRYLIVGDYGNHRALVFKLDQ